MGSLDFIIDHLKNIYSERKERPLFRYFVQLNNKSKMDDTIELSDSSTEKTIVLDDTTEKNKTIDLESSAEIESDKTTSDHYVTAASNTKLFENASPPKVTSTPKVQPTHAKLTSNSTLFQDVEDEFLHDDSFAEAEEATKNSPTEIEDIDNDDSAIESEKASAPIEKQHQISSDSEESSTVSSANDNQIKDIETDDEIDECDEDDEEINSSATSCSRKFIRRNVTWDELKLPDTCTMLTTSKGAKVFIIGTAHFSRESQSDVVSVMRAVQPDVVMLELCKSRTNILQMDEETILSESQNLTTQRAMQTLREYGTIQGIMYLLMLSMSANLTKTLGMAPGGEFRVAFRESQKIPGCIVHLGDRPIQITLKRALASLTTWQRIKLAFNVLTSKDEITKEDVERCKQKDLLESMLEEMAGEYPAMSRVFVDERDTFLAYSLRQASEAPVQNGSDGGLSEPPVIVGVVGIGHVNGIVQKFNNVCSTDVAKVIQLPTTSQSSKYIKLAIKGVVWTVAAYGI